ncbi:MAG TPA: energy-coupling factor ABC transporter substrate-binding protein [Fibrobacteraceae bacterium]|nr:energy-coupling factor ABC transporter substrate-binding protein [Fibrobacteraceae bacterium]
MKKQNLLLLIAVIVIAVIPLVFIHPTQDAEIFTGSDDQAESMITQIQPDYQPWFQPFWEPPSGEIESLLFALQAAIGAGAIGYVIGVFRGRKQAKGTTA